jgi:phenylacetate-CoA ligase
MYFIPHMVMWTIGRKLRFLSKVEEQLINKNIKHVKKVQLDKLNQLLQHYINYPFYKELLEKNHVHKLPLRSLEEISTLPIMTKQVIRENFKYISSRPEVNFITSTSGSTGDNFKFCHCKNEQNRQRAALILMYKWMGIDFFTDRNVTVWGTHLNSSYRTRLFQDIKRIVKNGKLFEAYGLNEHKAIRILQKINRFKPKLLTAYPGYAYELASTGAKNHCPIPKSLKAIVLSGEMVYDHQVARIENYFKCKVYRRYGSREFGNISHECLHSKGKLHVMPGRFHVETDRKGNLLITDLDNFATPFIRYNIGDTGEVEYGVCECGFKHQNIVNIEGRSHDVIRTRTGKQLPGQFWTTLSRGVPGIDKIQVVQTTDEEVEFRIVINDSYRETNEIKLHEQLHKIAGNEIQMHVVKTDQFELTPSGKHRYIIRR